MKRIQTLLLSFLWITTAFVMWVPAAAANGAVLTGSVKSATGERMDGVTVSAKLEGQTITTTVFTDGQGEFYFPGNLAEGKYKLWAQTQGYEAAQLAVELSGTARPQSLVLKPLKDYTLQLTSEQFLEALPGNTPHQKKMKEIIYYNCTGCHSASFPLQNRFDEKGWTAILNMMSRIGNSGAPDSKDKPPAAVIQYYKKELAAYLADARGPNSPPLTVKLPPRPKGEVARTVITEYEIPQGRPRPYFNGPAGYPIESGHDWAFGTPSSWNNGRTVHDATIDLNGDLWFATTEGSRGNRTLGKIDSKTGKVTEIRVPGPDGKPLASHGTIVDKKGMVWFTLTSGAGMGRIDPKTMKVETFIPPKDFKGRSGGILDFSASGEMWMDTEVGIIGFNPETREFKEYLSPTTPGKDGQTPEGLGVSYGVTVDREGNPWWTQFSIDRVNKADVKTGKVTEFKMPIVATPADDGLTPEDRKLNSTVATAPQGGRLGAPGPRRMKADHNGDSVWVCNYWSGDLVKFDMHTMKPTYYRYPNKRAAIYAAVVDKDHNVWVNLTQGDAVAKFDTKTEKWTEYPLPTRGTESRHLDIGEYDGKTHIVIGIPRTGKIARMDFRSSEELQSLKSQVNQQQHATLR